MLSQWKKHKLAYVLLITGLSLLTLLFMAAWPNLLYQRVIGIILAAYYIVWGIITHVKADHINSRVIFEYVAVGLLAGILLILVTF